MANKNETNCKSCGVKNQYKDNLTKNKGKNNGRFGKSCYSIWVDKYGKVEADIKLQELKKKQSINTSGINNPMYGKTCSNKSGGGWSGRYKHLFFRSLTELFFILEFEKHNIIDNLKNAETKEYYVKYKYKDKIKTYRPDFVYENCIYEIKSFRFPDTEITLIKHDSAENYFNKIGYNYKVIKNDFSIYNFVRHTLIRLVKENIVILNELTIKKLIKYAEQSRFKIDI